MRAMTILLVWLAGCNGGGLPQTGDGGGGGGGVDAGKPDASSESCSALPTDVTQWFASHQSCTGDSDCTFTGTRCGLPNTCGAIINATGASGLGALLSTWDAKQCSAGLQCGPCPGLFPQVACNAGVCGIKGAATCSSLQAQAQSAINNNQACAHDSDCFTVNTSCGLPGVCGAYVNQAGQSALQSIDAQYRSMNCQSGQPCPPCPFPGPAGCNQGTCGRKM
jgi:hypothetical protein